MTGFQGPVVVTIRPSPQATRAILAVHLAGAVAIAAVYPFTLPLCAMLCVLLVHGVVAVTRHWRRRSDDPVFVVLTSNDGWRLTLRDGTSLDATPCGEPFVTQWLTVIALGDENGRVRRIALFPDTAGADTLRRLRVRLLHGPGAAADV